jgi:ribosomal protein S18 acetylase RimI-like enzyme
VIAPFYDFYMPVVVADHARPEELEMALGLIFQYVERAARRDREVNALRLIRQGELDSAGVLVVRGPQGLRGAMVCQLVPGASALIWPPQAVASQDQEEIEDVLLSFAGNWLHGLGAKLAQCLLSPAEQALALPLLRNGFQHVTGLWYLRHQLEMSRQIAPPKVQLAFDPYSRVDQELFHRTLLRTYEETLDCPEVNGLRELHEIISGHQAQGRHDPGSWWLARDGDLAVGVLLLTEIPDWQGWDLSYIGVIPEARRRGIGIELTKKALREAKTGGACQLTLAVDTRNQPALKVYRTLGFERYDHREVFLTTWRS